MLRKDSLVDHFLKNFLRTDLMTLESFIEARVCSISPLMITDDYLNSFPVRVTEDMKKLLDEHQDLFDKSSLNLKIVFNTYQIIKVKENQFFTIILEIHYPLLKQLTNFSILNIQNIHTIKSIEKNQEVRELILKQYGTLLPFNSFIIKVNCST